ncbi:MAG TPA: N-acetylmuramoyl-L-alanine amidase [Thermomonospora sp.]|nr:N-acetylmuramoyl-L-alanine amidase [Thermomonospora sp.]
MSIRRRGPAAVALALSMGALAACGGGDDGGQDARTAPPPTATMDSTPTAGGSPEQPGGTGALRGKTIVIDPGHNGGNARASSVINRQVDIGNGRKACDTTGTATNAGYSEHAFTWDVSLRLRRVLQAQGAKVILTRSNDKGVGPCIDKRAAIGNDANADAVISVHADGAGPSQHGFHIIEPAYVRGVNTQEVVEESHELALDLRAAFRAGTGTPYSNYRGKDAIDRRDDLGGLNLSDVPKVFIECGNMRNSREAARLSDPGFRQKIANAIAKGVDDYLDD